MPRGKIRWFDEAGGYGCISPQDGDEDLFEHCAGISGEGFGALDEGGEFSRQATLGRKRMRAGDVSGARAAAWGLRTLPGGLS